MTCTSCAMPLPYGYSVHKVRFSLFTVKYFGARADFQMSWTMEGRRYLFIFVFLLLLYILIQIFAINITWFIRLVSYTTVLPPFCLFYHCFTTVLPLFSCSVTTVLSLFHHSFSTASPLSCNRFTTIYQSFATALPLLYHCFTIV